jgi:hypothetical protein
MYKCPHIITATLYQQDNVMKADIDRCALNCKVCILEEDRPCKIYDEELKKDAV